MVYNTFRCRVMMWKSTGLHWTTCLFDWRVTATPVDSAAFTFA